MSARKGNAILTHFSQKLVFFDATVVKITRSAASRPNYGQIRVEA
jgi:hypothetical protein